MDTSSLTSLGAKGTRGPWASLLNIKQWEDESLRSYVTWFNKESILIDKANDKVLVAFTNEFQSEEFLFSIYKNDPKMMANMLYKTMKYMNMEDALTAQGGRLKKRERQDDPRQDKRRKSAQTNEQREERRPRP